jgi:hypothetical protein
VLQVGRVAEQRERKLEAEQVQKLSAMSREVGIVKDQFAAKMAEMDGLKEAVSELEERHHAQLQSIAESQEEQVCVVVSSV